MKIFTTLIPWASLFLSVAAPVLAEEKKAPLPSADRDPFDKPATREEAEAELKKSLQVRKLATGQYAIGDITIDANAREVSIPAVAEFPATGEVVEYALVHENGKTHETLFSTAATPQQVHTACLLLSVKPVGGPGLVTPTEESLAQGALTIDVSWEEEGETVCHSLSKFVTLLPASGETEAPKPIKEDPWLYNGSMFGPRGFAAQSTGSIISLIGDLTALVNNIGPDAISDEIHFPNTDITIKSNTPVQVILQFPSKAAQLDSTP